MLKHRPFFLKYMLMSNLPKLTHVNMVQHHSVTLCVQHESQQAEDLFLPQFSDRRILSHIKVLKSVDRK